MNSLKELALKKENQTDKGDIAHSFAGQSYLDVYERYFAIRRNEVRELLEIGVLNGGSLRLWRDYFPNANIWGLDIDPKRSTHTSERIQVIIGDQSDSDFMQHLVENSVGFDVVIDDGSHVVNHILTSFRALWPHVLPNGIYAIEDLGISHNPLDFDVMKKFWAGQELNRNLTQDKHNRQVFESELLALIERMDFLGGNVRAVHFHPMMVILEKI